MPRSADLERIRRILETDRIWSAYALADLDPGYRDYSEWHAGRDAVALLYRGFDPPVLFTLGTPADIQPVLAEVSGEPRLCLAVPREILAVLADSGYDIRDPHRMWRMVLDADTFARPMMAAEPLGARDYDALQQLYAQGVAAGDIAGFFNERMLERGVYFGVRKGESLLAAAGTHIVSLSQSTAGLGNVYTRPEWRGCGLGAAVTAAVSSELIRLGIRTIVLNVEASNTGAIRIYERLGFRHYCEFWEAVAVRA